LGLVFFERIRAIICDRVSGSRFRRGGIAAVRLARNLLPAEAKRLDGRRECQGKDAAIQAAREMLARHAHRFDDRIEIETRIYPEIEWSEPLVEKSSYT
jgi:hypothetical protein